MTELQEVSFIWRADEYHDLSIAQELAASQLLSHLKIKEDYHILDIGCGDGKISAKLSTMVNEGLVLAIDKSSEMVQFAVQNFSKHSYPNLGYKVLSAEEISFHNEFDIVFSSFSLQWIKNKKDFFQKARLALKKEGALALIVPLRVSPELEEAVDAVLALPEWYGYFEGFHPGWYFSDSEAIKRDVGECFSQISRFHTTVQEVFFPSREALEKYILLWFPYLRPLPIDLRNLFFQEVLDKYFSLLPCLASGSAALRIPTLDLIAHK